MAKIVVVDSEETVRSVVTRILTKAGYSVEATGEFDEAVTLIRKGKPDLVLTNVFLRGIAGHDAMKVLKQEFPKLPVLMVSGLPDEDVIRTWTGESGFDVFPKPFTPHALLAKIDELLNSTGAQA